MAANQRGQAAAIKARSSFSKSIQTMMMPDATRPPESSEGQKMFYVKHRRLKNRNLVCQSLILSFNDKGVTAVQDLGNNRSVAEYACLHSRGQMVVVSDEVDAPEVLKPVPKPDVVAPVQIEKPKKIEKVEAKPSVVAEAKPSVEPPKAIYKSTIDVPSEVPEKEVVETLRNVAEEVVTSVKDDDFKDDDFKDDDFEEEEEVKEETFMDPPKKVTKKVFGKKSSKK